MHYKARNSMVNRFAFFVTVPLLIAHRPLILCLAAIQSLHLRLRWLEMSGQHCMPCFKENCTKLEHGVGPSDPGDFVEISPSSRALFCLKMPVFDPRNQLCEFVCLQPESNRLHGM